MVRDVIKQFGAENVSLTGHSLGGFLATYVGTYTNLPTVTFNAPGFNAKADIGPFSDNILNIQHQSDPVRNSVGPQRPGTEYPFAGDPKIEKDHKTQTGDSDSGTAHSMDVLVAILESVSGGP